MGVVGGGGKNRGTVGSPETVCEVVTEARIREGPGQVAKIGAGGGKEPRGGGDARPC